MAEPCDCLQCLRVSGTGHWLGGGFYMPVEMTRMILCPACGNKRCPHATDHHNPCTNSNEPGQPGSVYGGMKHD